MASMSFWACVDIISIHALREEGDHRGDAKAPGRKGISIHALREEGDARVPRAIFSASISIHALREEGDLLEDDSVRVSGISIHALREEGDKTVVDDWRQFFYFYPRPPRGGRPRPTAARTASSNFYPRPPRGGRLTSAQSGSARSTISIHALREEGDAVELLVFLVEFNFYPRPPRGGRPSAG